MKSKPRKKKMSAIIALTLLALLLIQISSYLHEFLTIYRGTPVGGSYEKISVRWATTREILLELAYQFEFDGELPNAYPDVFYDVMSVETLNEVFGIDFESEHELVAISRGREIGQLVYDVNWQFDHYEESWGYIAIAKYMLDYSPNTIYVYTPFVYVNRNNSKFPLNELYTGEFHNYFSDDIRDDDEGQEWFAYRWGSSGPSVKRSFWKELDQYLKDVFVMWRGISL
jgi:hypothetical protein